MSLSEALDALSMLRRFRPYLAGAGGLSDMMNALRWSLWYAAKWWPLARENPDTLFAKALRLSLIHHGVIDERGELKKALKEPERPRGPYAQEWLALHEAFDKIAGAVAKGEADRDVLEALLASMQSQGWYRLWRDGFLEAAGFKAAKRVFEPKMRGGINAVDIYKAYGLELYVGYEESREAAAALLEAVPAVEVDRCSGRGICVYSASSTCEVAEELRGLGVDSVLLFNVLHWFPDPLKELRCIAAAAPRARLYVGQPVVETMPGFIAINTALGAYHVFSREDVEGLLEAAGFKRASLLLRAVPFYAAVWAR
nr:MAG: hypothetical protein TU35_06125 [Thermoproteus sp. AZ2]